MITEINKSILPNLATGVTLPVSESKTKRQAYNCNKRRKIYNQEKESQDGPNSYQN